MIHPDLLNDIITWKKTHFQALHPAFPLELAVSPHWFLEQLARGARDASPRSGLEWKGFSRGLT